MVPELFPGCVVCWSGPSCKWLSLGACRFGHHGTEAVKIRQAGDSGESRPDVRVREPREALAKLAANVMWRNGVPVAVKAACWTTVDDIEEVK